MNMNEAPAARAAQLAEAARRTLKTLAERRQIPTPESFSDVYYELHGGKANSSPLTCLRDVLRDLLLSNRIAKDEAASMLEQARKGNWGNVHGVLEQVLARGRGGAGAGWPNAALTLLKGTDALHANWTRARKLDAITHVLETAASEPEVALERVRKLIDSWGPALAAVAPPRQEVSPPVPVAPPPPSPPVAERYANPDLPAQLAQTQLQAQAWQQVALRAVGLLEHACGETTPAATRLHEFVQESNGVAAAALLPRFADAVAAIDRQIEEEHRIKAGLQRLLGLLCDNMKSLTPEEAWLAGQLEPIRALLGSPLTAAQLSNAEHQLASVIERQLGTRRSLSDAKQVLKEMLSTLVSRIGAMGDSTGQFYEKIGGYQSQLAAATDIESMSHVVSGLLSDTTSMRGDLASSRDELEAAQRKVETYETRMRDLERELAQVATLVQKDPLTQVLNRRGLDDAFRVESARATRYGAPLAAVIIDVDNFKNLNDSLGHAAGDRALVHLVQAVRATLRPTDLIGRVGGEEFGFLLPATALDDAASAVERCLHMLAANPFRFDEHSRVLTFSAGVTAWHSGESLDEILKRADEAMYRAKRAGKNRVLKAD